MRKTQKSKSKVKKAAKTTFFLFAKLMTQKTPSKIIEKQGRLRIRILHCRYI